MEEQEFLNTLGDHVKGIAKSMEELRGRCNALRDNPKDRVACRESIRTLTQVTQSMQAAKDLKRKYSVWQLGDQSGGPRMKLKREKLFEALDQHIRDFNELSTTLTRISEGEEGVRVVTSSPSVATTASSASTLGLLPIHEQQECIQKVHQGIEATQQIFDELGSLVQRQAPHLDMLENSNTNTKHYSQEAANELQKEYRRRQRRARHLWTIFVMIVCTLFLMLYLYVRSPQGSNIITPTTPEANIPPLQQQPSLELESALASPPSSNNLLILRGSSSHQRNNHSR